MPELNLEMAEEMEPGVSETPPTSSVDTDTVSELGVDGPLAEVIDVPVVDATLSESQVSQLRKNQFHENIEERNFFEAFASVIEEAVQLNILTIVEDENESLVDGLENLKGKPGKRIATTIELLSGDIKNVIGSRFLEDTQYRELLNFHMDQVSKGQDIIKKNIDCLNTALKYLMDVYTNTKNSGN